MSQTFDGCDLSPILLPDYGFMPVVEKFPYLGDIIARDGSDSEAVQARVEAGGKAFGALRTTRICMLGCAVLAPVLPSASYPLGGQPSGPGQVWTHLMPPSWSSPC